MIDSDTCEECGERPELPYRGTAIRVTLTMNPDTARSVLGILEAALEEGDRNIADNPGIFDQFTIEHHRETKQSIERQVLAAIRAGFPG